jgi:hypothetical protein
VTKQDPSNFLFLETEFADTILSVREQDSSGRVSSGIVTRKTYNFHDNSYLCITEYYRKNKIDRYYYNWYEKNKEVILKFHSEEHLFSILEFIRLQSILNEVRKS